MRSVSRDDWDRLSPCEPWTCLDVIGHVVADLQFATAVIEGNDFATHSGFSASRSFIDREPLESWLSARRALQSACTPEALVKVVRWPFGEQPVDTGLGWFSLEVLVHTWDLARSLERDVALDAELMAEHMARLRPLSSLLRGPGGYGPELDPPPGAGQQEQFLTFLGRKSRPSRGE